MRKSNLWTITLAGLTFGALAVSAGGAEAQCAWGAPSAVVTPAAPGPQQCSNSGYAARVSMSNIDWAQTQAGTLSAVRFTGGVGCGGLPENSLGLLIIGSMVNFNTGAFSYQFKSGPVANCGTTISRSAPLFSNTGWTAGQCHLGIGAACVVPSQS